MLKLTTRRRFSNAMLVWLENNAKDYTARELVGILKEKFDVDFILKHLQQYLVRHDIAYKYEQPYKSHSNRGLPIGSERTKADGMVQVKVAPKKWEYKQRLIYEQYHNVKLKENEYVVFLDQNRNNFDIDNLQVLTAKESGFMANEKLFSKDKLATETGILATKLYYKTKEME